MVSENTWLSFNPLLKLSTKLGSVAGPVIQATGRLRSEDAEGAGGLVAGNCPDIGGRTKVLDAGRAVEAAKTASRPECHPVAAIIA